MLHERSPKPSSVDPVVEYYAISVSFTRGGTVQLRLTRFCKDPRHVTTTFLGEWQGKHRGPADAALWVNAATERWVAMLADQNRQDSGAYEQPELPF